MNLPDPIVIVLLATFVGGVTGWLLHLRARRVAAEQAATRIREMSQLIEHAPCVLWEAEVVRLANEWRWHMHLHPSEFCRQLFRERIPPPGVDLWADFQIDRREDMDRRARAALEEGKAGYEQEFRAVRGNEAYWLHEKVSLTRLAADRHLLVGLVTDRSAQREAEAARRESEQTVERILAQAQCMIWRATVVEEGGELHWPHFDMPSSRLSDRLFGPGPRVLSRELGFWDGLQMPQQAEMDARSTHAIRTGAPGYEQQFRVVARDGRTYWLDERVSIARAGEQVWSLVGVITDITAQTEAEELLRRNQDRLAGLLDVSECMIWEADVRRKPDDTLEWDQYIPPSALYRRIFGEPDGPLQLRWPDLEIPEYPEMVARTLAALKGGAPGYTQEFHIVRPPGDIWLREAVAIQYQGPDRFRMTGVITDTTAQRESDAARRVSEQRLKELLSRADCLFWESIVTLQNDGWSWQHHIHASLLYERLTGRLHATPRDEMWPRDRVPERAEMDRRCREAIVRGEPGYEQIFHYLRDGGEVVWIKESVKIHALGADRFSLVGVAVDITAQRRAEEASRESQSRLEEILKRADCLLWKATIDLAPDSWTWKFELHPSLLFQRLFGVSLPPPESGLWNKLDIPERSEMDRRCRAAMREGRPGYEQVFRVNQADGNVIWIRENVTLRALGGNRFSAVGVAVDITAARRAELALAQERERLAVTLRAMNEAVITTDPSGLVTFANPAAIVLLEVPADEVVGRRVEELCQLESMRTGEPVDVPVARVARGDAVADLPAQTRLVAPSGRRRVVEGRCAPIHATDSKVVGTVFVLRDVTEQDRLEQELVRATRLESVGVLAGGIAHDFNNILTAVMGNLSLAQLDLAPDSPAGTSLRLAEKAALRARDLTQQLLTFAKGGEPVRAAVQLDSVLRDITSFALSGSQVKAAFEIASGLWPADADKGQIGRVVQNLVLNAVQAMPRGGMLRVTARNDEIGARTMPGLPAGRYVRIEISDTGIGIRPENLARVFDPYFTTKDNGSGLGLAAVWSIIKKHHGRIEVESQIGQGTTFRLWLPALAQAGAAVESHQPWGPGQRLRGHVLFMDDEEIIRTMAGELLRRLGLEVDCAADGAEAVERYTRKLAAGRRFDLVIMDLTVPGGMGGLEAFTRLRALDPQVRAVVSSGYSSDPILANFRQHGFVAVIAKPYEIGEITRVLGGLLPPA